MREVTRSTSIPEDLTGQIFGTINDHVAAGGFGNVYRCEWRRPSTDPVKVAVKVIKFHTSKEDLRGIRREVAILARLVHENIVSLLGTTQGFGPSTALVSLWFPHGTLLRLITDKGGRLSIRSKLNLLHDIASGLHYLHRVPIVHGDLTSSNILVDIKEGEYKACLTNFGLSAVLGGILGDRMMEESTARLGAVRWAAPELLRLALDDPPGAEPTKQNDIYSFGRVMFHILTLLIPWDGLDDFPVLYKILSGEEIMRPEIPHATPDITDALWNKIEHCWSVDAPARPSTLMIMDFLTSELEALEASTDDDVLIGEAQEGSQTASFGMVDPVQTSDLAPRCLSPSEMEYSGSSYERPPHKTDELPLSSGSVGRGLQPHAETTTAPIPRSSRITPSSQHDSPPNTTTLPPSATSLLAGATGNKLHTHRLQKFAQATKNIVLFGETGAGKSSVVNLMAGEKKARTSPGMYRCTLHWEEYSMTFDGHSYKVFDTIGLEEPQCGMDEYLDAIVNAHNLITKLVSEGGIDLLLFCVRAGRITVTIQNNYRLFYEWLCEKKVPIVLVLTGLEREARMEDWWTIFGENFEKSKIFLDGHACITASNLLDGRHQKMYEDSRQLIRKLVREHTHDRPERRSGSDGWFRRVIHRPRELLQGDRSVGKKDMMNILTKRCGVPPEAAAELVKQLLKNRN